MARSPIMRKLRRWIGESNLAARRGVSTEQLRDERREANEQRMTRRTMLGAMAGAAALGACGGSPLDAVDGSRSEALRTQKRIAIVGGGIAGLTCAMRLKDKGVASTVYESSGRLGGRMFSRTSGWDNNQVSEWCGELIDTSHKTIRELARRFDLALENVVEAEPDGSEDTIFIRGEYYHRADVERDWEAVREAVVAETEAAGYPTSFNSSTEQGRALDNMSVRQWIEQRIPGGVTSRFGQLLDIAYAIEYGADTTDQSALNLLYLLGFQPKNGFGLFGVSDEYSHIRGGNQQLPTKIAQYLGSAIETGMRMESIRRRADGSPTLTFASGGQRKVVDADYVILALPFAVLRELDFAQAGFDDRKQRTIREMGAGRNAKLQLQFRQRLWNNRGQWGVGNGATYSDLGYQATWDVTRAQPGPTGILVNYTGGSVTQSLQTGTPYSTQSSTQTQNDARRFLSQLERVFPGITREWNGKVSCSIPHLSPDLRLAYSYWKVGQYQRYGDYGAVPQGNVFFTGEHTSTDFQGFMEGGAVEGIRAADEILKKLGPGDR